MLIGCTDKHTLDVFFQELGLRLFKYVWFHCLLMIVLSLMLLIALVLILTASYYFLAGVWIIVV